MAILRAEKLLTERNTGAREGVEERRGAGDHSCVSAVFVEFLNQQQVGLLDVVDASLEILVAYL